MPDQPFDVPVFTVCNKCGRIKIGNHWHYIDLDKWRKFKKITIFILNVDICPDCKRRLDEKKKAN